METEGARALLERAGRLTLQTGNLLNWGCLRKKCPATPSEEVSGGPELPFGAPRRRLALALGGPGRSAGGSAAEGALGAAARCPSGGRSGTRSGGARRGPVPVTASGWLGSRAIRLPVPSGGARWE